VEYGESLLSGGFLKLFTFDTWFFGKADRPMVNNFGSVVGIKDAFQRTKE
jgi:hypothetical protein